MTLLREFDVQNLDLLSLGITIAAIGILGFIVFFNNRHSATNKVFMAFSFFTILYGVVNYASYQSSSLGVTLWLLRLTLFSAVWHAFSFFQLAYVFPRESTNFSKIFKFIVVPVTIVTSFLTLTPLVFSGVKEIQYGRVAEAVLGPAMPIFGLVSAVLVVLGIFFFFKRTKKSVGLERSQMKFVFVGTIVTFSLILTFNLIFPALLNNTRFIPLAPVFIFPFIVFTFYAIIKHGLLNVRIIAAEIFSFVIAVTLLFEVLLSKQPIELVFRSGMFILVLAFGLLLIRSVRQEVDQRERLELLAKELQTANARLKELDDLKTDFISIASHQLRTPLTAIKGYASMIMEGVYGDAPLTVRGVVDKIFQSAQRLIFIVNDLLDVSRIEQGRMQLAFEEVKALNVLKDVVEELKPTADKKGLSLELHTSVDDAEIKVKADYSKLRQVFTNLIDNSLKYTPSGFVKVALERKKDAVLMSVKDSGIGLSEETMQKLFQKFSRARGATRLRADGSGLGLYIVREIIKAHGGETWAESAGEGKGSQFYVSLPIHNPAAEAAQ